MYIDVVARKNDSSPLFMFMRNRDFKVYIETLDRWMQVKFRNYAYLV